MLCQCVVRKLCDTYTTSLFGISKMNDMISYLVSMAVMSAIAESHTNSTYPDSLMKNGTGQTHSDEGSQTKQHCDFDIGTIYAVFGLASGLVVYGLILTILVLVLTCIHLRTKNRLHTLLLKYRHSNSNGEANLTAENPEQTTELTTFQATKDEYETIQEADTVHCKEEENSLKKSNNDDKDSNESTTGNNSKRESNKNMNETVNNSMSNNKTKEQDIIKESNYANTSLSDAKTGQEENKESRINRDNNTKVIENRNSETNDKGQGDMDIEENEDNRYVNTDFSDVMVGDEKNKASRNKRDSNSNRNSETNSKRQCDTDLERNEETDRNKKGDNKEINGDIKKEFLEDDNSENDDVTEL